MKYRPEWRGKLRLDVEGRVWWQGEERGSVQSRHVEGATSPGGMTTNTVFVAYRQAGRWPSDRREFASLTLAIEFILG